jgi:hypothetical protein
LASEPVREISPNGDCEAIVREKSESDPGGVPSLRGRKDFPAAAHFARPRLQCVRSNFLAIESSVSDGEKCGASSVLDCGDRRTIQVALVIESRVANKLGVLRIRDRTWRPLEEVRCKLRGAKLRKIDEKDGAGVGGHGRQQRVAHTLA